VNRPHRDKGQSRSDRRRGSSSRPGGASADPQVLIAVSQETGKTIRFAFGCTAFVLAMMLVVWGVVQINAKEEPWWKILFFTAAPPISIVGSAIIWVRLAVKKKIDKLSVRNRNLEKSVDPTRDSSELLEDGTHPHD
jgi:hypothetical protein